MIFSASENLIFSPNIGIVGGNSKIVNAEPSWVILHVQGIDKRIRMER